MLGRVAGRLMLTLAVCATPATWACGYEDPQSVAIGALNFAYPNALYVGTAVWQAQLDGLLPREATVTATMRNFATPLNLPGAASAPGDPAASIALMRALALLQQARDRLARSEVVNTSDLPPPLAVAFASKALWTRFVPTPNGLEITPHASSAEPGDVVLITEEIVLRALVDGRLTPATALDRGLVRWYGADKDGRKTQDWLAALAPPK